MKADIDENGKLSIIPETATEAFALKQWWKDYLAQNSDLAGEHFAVIEICRMEKEQS